MSKSSFSDLFSEISSKWSSHLLKKRTVSAKRDPKRNFLAFYYEDKENTQDLLSRLKNEAQTLPKVHSPRVEVCVSIINSSDAIEFCKKGNEYVTGPHFTSGLIGVQSFENHELQNLTANNSVFIFKCRRNKEKYEPFVNNDECLVNISWLMADFEKIDVIAGSSYILEADAIYFWYAVNYSHVIIHRTRDQSTAVTTAASTESSTNDTTSSANAANESCNGEPVGKKSAKRTRSESNKCQTQGDSGSVVDDDEVHIKKDKKDNEKDGVDQELQELRKKCKVLQEQLSKCHADIEVKKKELKLKGEQIEKQKTEIEMLQQTISSQQETIEEQKKLIDSAKPPTRKRKK